MLKPPIVTFQQFNSSSIFLSQEADGHVKFVMNMKEQPFFTEQCCAAPLWPSVVLIIFILMV